MREIKFRMWTGQRYIYDQNIVFDCMRQQYSGLYDHVKLHESDFEQFTGLYDKNGKEIYEGDILGFPKTGVRIIVKIEISSVRDRFGWGEDGYSTISGFYFSGYSDIKSYEIIGNIHENKNLLGINLEF